MHLSMIVANVKSFNWLNYMSVCVIDVRTALVILLVLSNPSDISHVSCTKSSLKCVLRSCLFSENLYARLKVQQ